MKGKERIAKRAFKVLVAATMVVTSTQFGSFAVQAEVERQNFALNQEASANYEDSANGFDAEKAFDGNDELSSRWAAKEGERTGWLSVDLGRERTFDEFRILAEKDAQKKKLESSQLKVLMMETFMKQFSNQKTKQMMEGMMLIIL